MDLCYNEFGDTMKIKGKSRIFNVVLCERFFLRLKGNMGRKNIQDILLFPKCNSIHTFFMREAIDVVMISKENQVLYVRNHLTPYHIILPKKNVYATLEFPREENPYQVGDLIHYQKDEE